MNREMTFVKLGDICKFINGDRGKNYPSGADIIESGIPFINAGHLQNKKIDFTDMNFISREKYDLLGSGKVMKNDILYCLRGSLGKHSLCDIDEGAIASSLVIIRPNRKVVNERYLMHYLDSNMINVQQDKANNGSSQPNLSANSVKQFEVYLPKYDKQVKIADMLDKSQSLIDKRKSQIQALDELVKSRFIEMFGDPVKNTKNFHKKKIRDISIYLKRGISPKYVEVSDIKVINQKCIYWRELKIENCKYYDEEFRDKVKNIFLQQGDILINSTGTGTLGRAMNFNVNDNIKYVVDSHVTVLRVIYEYINSIYLTNLLEFSNIQDTIYKKCVNGSTNQIELSVIKFAEYSIIVPPIQLQNQFADFVNKVDKLKFEMESSLKELENNFNSLMQRAFKGELFS